MGRVRSHRRQAKRDGQPCGVLNRVSAIPLFGGCSETELEAIAGLGTAVTVAPGRVISRQGDHRPQFVVALSGSGIVRAPGNEPSRFEFGDNIGKGVLLDATSCPATIVAMTRMELLVFDRAEFETLLERSPHVARRLLASRVARTSVTARDRVGDVRSDTSTLTG